MVNNLSPGSPGDFSLYFHIPFCTRKCDYCHFYVIPDKDPYKILLMEGFAREWSRLKSLTTGRTLKSIYFGGGTPSLMGAHHISEILSWVTPSSEIEITLETNPENMTVETMRDYASAGINRVSIGIQTLDNALLKKLGRLHDANRAIDAVEATFAAGINNISVDLMYDLPGQELVHWENTLNRVCLLPITHLSLYNLTIEPHTVFFKKRVELEKILPDENVSLQMYEMAVEKLEKAVLKQYEISAFAREGFHSRHNVGYWTGRPFLGLGPSAFSYWDNKRYRNIANLNKYHQLENSVDFEERLDDAAKVRELLAIRLRLMEGVDLREWKLDHETMKVLEDLVRQGLLESVNDRLRMTRRGILFYDTIATEIV